MPKVQKLTGEYIQQVISTIIADIDRAGIANRARQGQLYTTLAELMKLRALYPSKEKINK